MKSAEILAEQTDTFAVLYHANKEYDVYQNTFAEKEKYSASFRFLLALQSN